MSVAPGISSRAPGDTRTPWRQDTGQIARHLDYGAGHRWLDLDVPGDFPTPDPGQFVQLLLPAPAPVLLPRPMSVASAAPSRGALRLGFLYAPVGGGTHALAQLAPGAKLDVLGPLGHGYPLEVPGTPVLVAGGRGVAPLLFAAAALALRRRRCEFLFGARTRELLVGLEDARRRLTRLGGRLHLATDDGTRGFRGTVVTLLSRIAARLPQPLVVHACGPHPMLRAVAEWAVAHDTPAFLAMESVMACGTGVCRGCPMPRSARGRAAYTRNRAHVPSLWGNREYAMCCTEGPVFAAHDLDWERVE
jgi:dihydroorotate dehydrogenase electron transfer subunit